jgi:hypothetical protein
MKMTQTTITGGTPKDKLDLEEESQGEMTLMLIMTIRMIMIQKTIRKIKRKLKTDK